MVGFDGGVFMFGNAKFTVRCPGWATRDNIRGIFGLLAGTGYAMVGSDGGVFNFGTGIKYYG